MVIAVLVMAEEVNRKLSVVGPAQLTQRMLGPGQLTEQTATTPPESTDDVDTVRKVTFETPTSETPTFAEPIIQSAVEPDQSAAGPSQLTAEPTTLPVNSILASMVMECAKITLYWGSTDLVLFSFSLVN